MMAVTHKYFFFKIWISAFGLCAFNENYTKFYIEVNGFKTDLMGVCEFLVHYFPKIVPFSANLRHCPNKELSKIVNTELMQ